MVDLEGIMKSIMEELNSPETAERLRKATEEAEKKYGPLHAWRERNSQKPKNLMEAVIQRETYKGAYNKVFGDNA